MNTVIQIIFFVLSALVLVSGIMVVFVRNIIHAALWLIASFAGVSALYFLFEAPFIGVVQILVYAGAVSILMLFAIMLTRQITGEATRQLFERWWVAAIVAIGIFALVLVPTIFSPGLPAANGQTGTWPRNDLIAATAQPAEGAANQQTASTPAVAGALEIGRSFMREYLLPFEVASILLLVALIGAVVIAYEERTRRRRVLTLAEEAALRRSLKGAESDLSLAASAGDVPGQAGNTARSY
jgi:NADH-quinone oxidoreductase subunit J